MKTKNEVEEKGDEEKLSMIQFLMKQYEKIFEILKGLPPKRVVHHQILALEG